MVNESFHCHSCGQQVSIKDRSRYLLSPERPGVCDQCGARHVFDASVRLDDSWVRRRLSELSSLRDLIHRTPGRE